MERGRIPENLWFWKVGETAQCFGFHYTQLRFSQSRSQGLSSLPPCSFSFLLLMFNKLIPKLSSKLVQRVDNIDFFLYQQLCVLKLSLSRYLYNCTQQTVVYRACFSASKIKDTFYQATIVFGVFFYYSVCSIEANSAFFCERQSPPDIKGVISHKSLNALWEFICCGN